MEKDNSRARRRNLVILLVIIGIGAGITPLLVYNYNLSQNRNPTPWSVVVFGSGTSGNVTIPYDDLTSGFYTIVNDVAFFINNRLNFNYTYMYTGVSVWDLLEKSGVLAPNATGIRFWSEDNYRCEVIPINLVQNHKFQVILGYIQDGKFLKSKVQGGDGPLRSVINFTVSQLMEPPTYNSQFWVKYTNAIEVIVS
ncbi:MAG: hypothetical protein ACTSUE_19270 [Promethearchaeota archaeon]